MRALLDLLQKHLSEVSLQPDALFLLNCGSVRSFAMHPVIQRFQRVVCADASPFLLADNRAVCESAGFEYSEAGLAMAGGPGVFHACNFPRFDGLLNPQLIEQQCPGTVPSNVEVSSKTNVAVCSLQELIDRHAQGVASVAVLVNAGFDRKLLESMLGASTSVAVRILGVVVPGTVQLNALAADGWVVHTDTFGLSRDKGFMAIASAPSVASVPALATDIVSETHREPADDDLRQKLEQERDQALARGAELAAELDLLSARNANLQQELSVAVSSAESRLEAERESGRQALAAFEHSTHLHEQEKGRLQDELSQLRAELDHTRHESRVHADDRDSALRDASGLRAQIDLLKAEQGKLVSDHAKALTDAETKLKQELQRIASLQQQKESLEKDLRKARDEAAALKRENAELLRKGREQDARQQMMNEELAKAEGQIELIRDLLLRERDAL